ncbi:MAG: Zn-ribbon domain-containing OB-fold protein [Acidimicrobiia bacterium]
MTGPFPSGEDWPRPLVPRVPPEAEEFFAGALRGELRVQRCEDCGLHQHYPRVVCSHCGSDAVAWVTASGRGTVHSFTVIRQNGVPVFKERQPFVVALVDLAEPGARMLASMPGVAPEDARIGMPVTAVFRPVSDTVAFVDFAADSS